MKEDFHFLQIFLSFSVLFLFSSHCAKIPQNRLFHRGLGRAREPLDPVLVSPDPLTVLCPILREQSRVELPISHWPVGIDENQTSLHQHIVSQNQQIVMIALRALTVYLGR